MAIITITCKECPGWEFTGEKYVTEIAFDAHCDEFHPPEKPIDKRTEVIHWMMDFFIEDHEIDDENSGYKLAPFEAARAEYPITDETIARLYDAINCFKGDHK